MKRLMSLMLGMGLGGPSAMPAGSYTVLLGTYTRDRSEGIYAVQMDGETGKLSAAGLVQAMTDPEFLALHPHGRIVYALTREAPKEGGVVVLALDPATGGLTELDRGFVAGGTFCHLVVDPAGRRLMAASYDGGFTAHWALDAEGRLAGQGKTIEHGGELGPHGGRQEAPHAHSVTMAPKGDFAFVADLGLDRVIAYGLSGAARSVALRPDLDVIISAGAGPRHSTFSPAGDSFYVLNELDGTITVFTYEAETGTLDQQQHLSILPEGYQGRISSSEIRAHPNGRFVYAANRGDNTLIRFARDETTGQLTRLDAVSCGGKNPRNFAISPDGKWLLCANQDSHLLTSFRVDTATGMLTPTGSSVAAPRTVCVLFGPNDST